MSPERHSPGIFQLKKPYEWWLKHQKPIGVAIGTGAAAVLLHDQINNQTLSAIAEYGGVVEVVLLGTNLSTAIRAQQRAREERKRQENPVPDVMPLIGSEKLEEMSTILSDPFDSAALYERQKQAIDANKNFGLSLGTLKRLMPKGSLNNREFLRGIYTMREILESELGHLPPTDTIDASNLIIHSREMKNFFSPDTYQSTNPLLMDWIKSIKTRSSPGDAERASAMMIMYTLVKMKLGGYHKPKPGKNRHQGW